MLLCNVPLIYQVTDNRAVLMVYLLAVSNDISNVCDDVSGVSVQAAVQC